LEKEKLKNALQSRLEIMIHLMGLMARLKKSFLHNSSFEIEETIKTIVFICPALLCHQVKYICYKYRNMT